MIKGDSFRRWLGQLAWDQWLAIGLSLVLMGYAVLRAILVPVVFDEVFTFNQYILTGGFQPFYSRLDANNNLINSTLGHLSFLAFGDGPLALRLPNVLALGVYLYYLIRFRDAFQNKVLWLSFFLSLALIHYVFDFFSLCRGYGLSLAFLMGSLFHTWQYAELRTIRAFCLALGLLSLAIWSNLSLMVPVLALASMLLVVAIAVGPKDYKDRITLLVTMVILFVIPVVYAVQFSMALKDGGRLYLGAGFSLNEAIGGGLLRLLLNATHEPRVLLIALLGFYLMLLVAVLVGGKLKWSTTGFLVAFILAVAGVLALNVYLGINFPIRRTAMHLPWLMLGSIFFLLDAVPRLVALGIGWSMGACLTANFLVNINLNHVIDWKYECVPHSFTALIAQRYNETGQMPSVSCGEHIPNIISYHTRQNQSGFISTSGPVYFDGQTDFVIASDSMQWGYRNQYDTLDFNAATGITLMQRIRPAKKELIFMATPTIATDHTGANIPRFDSLTNLAGRVLSVEVSMTVQCDQRLPEWTFYAQIWGNTKCISNTQFDLHPARYDLRTPQTIRISREVAIVRNDAKQFRCFIATVGQKSLKITNVHVAIYASIDRP